VRSIEQIGQLSPSGIPNNEMSLRDFAFWQGAALSRTEMQRVFYE